MKNPKTRLKSWADKGIYVAVLMKSGAISVPKYVLDKVKPSTLLWKCYLDEENKKLGIQFTEKGDRRAYRKHGAAVFAVRAVARMAPGPGLYPISIDPSGMLIVDLSRPLELLQTTRRTARPNREP